jgi:protein required for attachment to host cells
LNIDFHQGRRTVAVSIIGTTNILKISWLEGDPTMKAKRTWVLVADGGKARILENLGPGKGVHQVSGLEEDLLLPPNRELQTDRPGRGFESAGPTRHAYETTDPHREMKRTFAGHLMERLAGFHAKGMFDRLVLVAPPAMLGDLRSQMGAAITSSLIGELARDLTHVPTNEMHTHLDGLISI